MDKQLQVNNFTDTKYYNSKSECFTACLRLTNFDESKKRMIKANPTRLDIYRFHKAQKEGKGNNISFRKASNYDRTTKNGKERDTKSRTVVAKGRSKVLNPR